MARYCVFTGSREGSDLRFTDGATALGVALARRGHGLVYGGARSGLMGAVADAVLRGGGEVIGVLPNFMGVRELAHPHISQLIRVETMHERKARMTELADGFIALPGGLGTLDELFEILTWGQLGLHGKPVTLLNVAGYFDGLLAFLRQAVGSGFIPESQMEDLLVFEEPAGLLDRLETFHPGPAHTKWS